MNLFQKSSLALALFAGSTIPSTGATVVSDPSNTTQVQIALNLTAAATTCSSQPVVAMGYSIDNQKNIAVALATALQGVLTYGSGAHTLHVKAWGNKGAVCVTDLALSVVNSNSIIPSNAISVANIQALNSWKSFHDPVTGAASNGMMSTVSSPSQSGTARRFDTSYVNSGGELYYVTIGKDPTATNFLYDTWVYLENPTGSIANLEMDLNQVLANGQTVIYGVQCSSYSGTWEYTTNAGTPELPVDQWDRSTAPCDPRKWTPDTWHHVQISYSRDANGLVTYKSIWLDGAESVLNVTTPSAFALGWASTLVTNFQVDGLGTSGSSTVYVDNLTVFRW